MLPTRYSLRASSASIAGVVRPNTVASPTLDPDVLAPPPSSGEPDNLLLAKYKGRDIEVFWTGFDDAYPGDIITYYSQGSEFDQVIVGEGDEPPYVGTLPGTKAWASEGLKTLSVRYQTTEGGGDDSLPVPFWTDTIAPGAPHLAALEFDPADNIEDDGITADKLRTDPSDTNGPYIYAEIAGYTGKDFDDQLILKVNDKVGDPMVVPFGNKIEVRLYKSLIDQVDDGKKATITYTVTDRAGNASRESVPVTVSIQMSQIGDLEEPTVPEYDRDDLIDEADARGVDNGGFEVVVPWNARFQTGDSIVITLDDQLAGPVPVGPADEDMRILFPYAGSQAVWLAGSSGSDKQVDADVSYVAYRGGARLGISPPHAVILNLYQKAIDPDPETPENEALQPAVLISDSGEEDAIPVGDFDKDATIEIAKMDADGKAEAIEDGDVLNVYYGSQPVIEFSVDDVGDTDEPVQIPLDKALIKAQGSGKVPLWYEIVHELADGGSNTNLAPTKMVDVHGKDTQPGEGYLAPGVFADANSNGHIPLDFHHSQTKFVIPGYANRDSTDVIDIHFQLYASPKHNVGEQPYKPAEKYDWNTRVTAGSDSETIVVVPYTAYNVYGNTDGYSAYIHIHATYTVTKKAPGDTTPVTSEQATVACDARFPAAQGGA